MADFDIYITQGALDSGSLYDIVMQTVGYVEYLERMAQPLPEPLDKFLSLDIYIGRSRNSGHQGFCHRNYNFPDFAEEAAGAARVMGAEEYAVVIEDLGKLMTSALITDAGGAAFDWDRHEELGLKEPFQQLDRRSYSISLPPEELQRRIAYCPEDVRTWVMARYGDGNGEDMAYYALAAAWLSSSANVIVQTREERKAMLALPSKPKPAPVAKKGWLSKLLKR